MQCVCVRVCVRVCVCACVCVRVLFTHFIVFLSSLVPLALSSAIDMSVVVNGAGG